MVCFLQCLPNQYFKTIENINLGFASYIHVITVTSASRRVDDFSLMPQGSVTHICVGAKGHFILASSFRG
jgi:hypothetical protein